MGTPPILYKVQYKANWNNCTYIGSMQDQVHIKHFVNIKMEIIFVATYGIIKY